VRRTSHRDAGGLGRLAGVSRNYPHVLSEREQETMMGRPQVMEDGRYDGCEDDNYNVWAITSGW
jgi:hypothetical protein